MCSCSSQDLVDYKFSILNDVICSARGIKVMEINYGLDERENILYSKVYMSINCDYERAFLYLDVFCSIFHILGFPFQD